MQGFFRSFGLLCTNFDSAFRLATFFVPNMIQYIGYMIPVSQMKRWLFWIVSCNAILGVDLVTDCSISSISTPLAMVRIYISIEQFRCINDAMQHSRRSLRTSSGTST